MDPSSDVVIQGIIIVILLILSGFFSSTETALTTVNRIRMRTLAEAGSKPAMYVNKVVEDQGKMLSAILIGNNIVNLNPKMEYKISVEAEEFNLKPYRVNTKR